MAVNCNQIIEKYNDIVAELTKNKIFKRKKVTPITQIRKKNGTLYVGRDVFRVKIMKYMNYYGA